MYTASDLLYPSSASGCLRLVVVRCLQYSTTKTAQITLADPPHDANPTVPFCCEFHLTKTVFIFVQGDVEGVRRALFPFTAQQVAKSRRQTKRLDVDSEGFTTTHMYTLRKVLQRLPRHVTKLTEQR